ncbi:MAG: zf-TFIIB domain-containing protein [Brachymonas sp.]|nr:zf-TFIIB domain-containing protein [Brachymonas sp.]
MPKSLPCPSCKSTLQTLQLTSRENAPVTLEVCFACQGIWFDRGENLALSPASVLELFEQLHARRNEQHLPQGSRLTCLHCKRTLVKGYDQVRTTRYMLHRCPQGHGHFIGFSAFMAEKGFMRQLSATEVQQLAAHIRTVNCTGCGAPVDIRNETACPHCQSAFSVLDADAVDKALHDHLHAQKKLDAPPKPEDFAVAMADIHMQRERAKRIEQMEKGQITSSAYSDNTVDDLLEAGLELLGKWLWRKS